MARLRRHGYTTATLEVAALWAHLPQIRRRVVLVAGRGGFNPPAPSHPTRPKPLRSVLSISSGVSNHDPRQLDPASRAARIAAHIGLGQKLSNVRNASTSIHTWDIPEVFGNVTLSERGLLQDLLLLRRRHRVRTFGDADPVPYSILKSRFGSSTSLLLTSLLEKRYLRQMGPDHYDLRATFNGKFRRLHPDEPAHCVLTKFCDPSHFLHPFDRRGFTVPRSRPPAGISRLLPFPWVPEATSCAGWECCAAAGRPHTRTLDPRRALVERDVWNMPPPTPLDRLAHDLDTGSHDPEARYATREPLLAETVNEIRFHARMRYWQFAPTYGTDFEPRLVRWLSNPDLNPADQKALLELVPQLQFIDRDDTLTLYRAAFNEQVGRWIMDQVGLDFTSPEAHLKRAITPRCSPYVDLPRYRQHGYRPVLSRERHRDGTRSPAMADAPAIRLRGQGTRVSSRQATGTHSST